MLLSWLTSRFIRMPGDRIQVPRQGVGYPALSGVIILLVDQFLVAQVERQRIDVYRGLLPAINEKRVDPPGMDLAKLVHHIGVEAGNVNDHRSGAFQGGEKQ
ncbi:hypothetical protein EG834_03620 [bacterium]|nr:hypothetical protein [bacterium]